MTESSLSAITRFLTPEIVGKMATASGLERDEAQKAIGAAVPALLGGISQLASQPGGARQLANAMAEQPAGMLGSLASALGGSAQLADQGNSLLSSLLGPGTLSSMVSGISSYVGINEGSMRTLLGLLSPVVMGILGRQQRSAGMDSSSFARMLAGQKQEFAAAMPAGLADHLPRDVHEGFEAPSTMAGRPYEFPRQTSNAPRATNGVMRAVGDGRPEQARMTWAYWLVPLLALGALLWFLLPADRLAREAFGPATDSTTTGSSPPNATAVSQAPGTRSNYLTQVADDSMSATSLQNQEIYNRTGERLGTIKDVLLAPDGKVPVAVLSVGRFLGIGEKDVAVPFSSLLIERRNGTLRISIDAVKDTLQSAPAFEQARESTRTNGSRMLAPQATTPPAAGKGDASSTTRP